jgi:hypothetical protein
MGVNPHRNNVMLRCNNCKHVSPLLFASGSAAAGHWIGGLCAVRAIEALHVPGEHRGEAVYTEGPRFPSDRASLKVLAYEGSPPHP